MSTNKTIASDISTPGESLLLTFSQVCRLGFFLLRPLPTQIRAVGLCPFVSFTATGIARTSHPLPSLPLGNGAHAQLKVIVSA